MSFCRGDSAAAQSGAETDRLIDGLSGMQEDSAIGIGFPLARLIAGETAAIQFVLTYVLGAAVVLIVIFAGFIALIWRRTSRTAISVSGSGPASPPLPPGEDPVLQSPGHEPFSWDQSW
jgi:hypothetical protein